MSFGVFFSTFFFFFYADIQTLKGYILEFIFFQWKLKTRLYMTFPCAYAFILWAFFMSLMALLAEGKKVGFGSVKEIKPQAYFHSLHVRREINVAWWLPSIFECVLKVRQDEGLILICLIFIASFMGAFSHLCWRDFYLESSCCYSEET